jgi:hypothetical protein
LNAPGIDVHTPDSAKTASLGIAARTRRATIVKMLVVESGTRECYERENLWAQVIIAHRLAALHVRHASLLLRCYQALTRNGECVSSANARLHWS